jgi:DNA-binding SARP family transcriptional activator
VPRSSEEGPVPQLVAAGAPAAVAATAPRLSLLRSFSLTHASNEIAVPWPAQRLIAFLALQDRPVLRETVAGTLWLDATQAHASGSLRSALWRLRQPNCRLVEALGGRLQLSPDLDVDVHHAAEWARRQLRETAVTDGDLDGIALAGDILPDWYDDWIIIERERFRQLRVHALEALCPRLCAAGRFGHAMEAGLAAIAGEPLRESAHRAVIGVHLAEGNRAAALVHYRRFRDLLYDELGLAPSARMHELVSSPRLMTAR